MRNQNEVEDRTERRTHQVYSPQVLLLVLCQNPDVSNRADNGKGKIPNQDLQYLHGGHEILAVHDIDNRLCKHGESHALKQ